jgi:hypothetical protein
VRLQDLLFCTQELAIILAVVGFTFTESTAIVYIFRVFIYNGKVGSSFTGKVYYFFIVRIFCIFQEKNCLSASLAPRTKDFATCTRTHVLYCFFVQASSISIKCLLDLYAAYINTMDSSALRVLMIRPYKSHVGCSMGISCLLSFPVRLLSSMPCLPDSQ